MDEKEKVKLGIEKRNSWLRFIASLVAVLAFEGVCVAMILSPGASDAASMGAWSAFIVVNEYIILDWIFKRKQEKEKFDGGEK